VAPPSGAPAAESGRTCSAELLKQAITAAAAGGPALELIVKKQDLYRTIALDYRGGLRYPHFTARR
jgi:hypothetical protein